MQVVEDLSIDVLAVKGPQLTQLVLSGSTRPRQPPEKLPYGRAEQMFC